MMKKLLAMLAAMLLTLSVACAEESGSAAVSFGAPGAADASAALPSLDDLTGISAFLEHVTADNPIVSACFSEGSGLPDASFSTGDPAELQLLLDAVLQLAIESESEIFVTDWYACLSFTCADGRCWGLGFNGPWLAAGGRNYSLVHDETLRAALTQLRTGH